MNLLDFVFKKILWLFIFTGIPFVILCKDDIVFRDILGNESILNPTVKKQIHEKYFWLKNSIYFKSLEDPKNKKESVRNPKWVREICKSDPSIATLTVQTEDGLTLPCLYFDRGKENLVVMGHGLADVSYKMILYAEIFHDCDVLIIGFRGHSLAAWYELRPWKRFFNIDFNCKFGEKEQLDVFAAVEKVKELKKYENIIGFGPCYGAFVLAKAQGIKEANNEKLFDKLILYESWPNGKAFIEKYAKDPGIAINHQKHSYCANLTLCKNGHLKKLFLWIIQTFFEINCDKLNLVPYLQNIKNTPVLLLHATNDIIVSNEEFEVVFNSLATQNKQAVFFPCTHSRSHVWEKEVFAYVCNEFIYAKEKHENFKKL
ncbi:MAG: hypothetical protein ABIA74_03240 [bacterium]